MGVTGIGAERIREGVRALSRLVRGDLSSDSRRIEDEAVEPLRGKALQRAMAGTTLLYNTVYGEPCTLELRSDGDLVGTAGYAGQARDRGHWWTQEHRWYRQWHTRASGAAAGFAGVGAGDPMRFYTTRKR